MSNLHHHYEQLSDLEKAAVDMGLHRCRLALLDLGVSAAVDDRAEVLRDAIAAYVIASHA